MPRLAIPRYTARETPQGYVRGVIPGAVDTSGLSQGVANASSIVTHEADRAQREFDTTAVNDAMASQFSPALRDLFYNPETGFMTKQGKDAMVALPEVQKQAEALREKASGALSTERQRNYFNALSRNHMASELDAAFRHASREEQVWKLNTSNAVVNESMNAAINRYNDPTYVDGAIGSALFEMKRYGLETGQSAEVTLGKSREFIRQTRTAIAQRMMVDDPIAARDYVREHSGELAGPQLAILEHQVKQAALPVEAKLQSDQIINGGQMPNPDAIPLLGDPLINAIVQQESGGKVDAKSPKGALGLMQLMPDTARQVAAQLGMEYNPERLVKDAAYNKALGAAYMREMLGRYGGNQTLALAAYNAGPSRVDKWLTTIGNPNTGAITSEEWAAKIPFPETRDYVSRINASAPPKATDTKAQLGPMIDQAELVAQVTHPNDPIYRDMLTNQIKSHVATIAAVQRGTENAAHDALMSVAVGAGKGSPRPTSLAELLSTPQAIKAWQATGADGQRGLIAMLDHNAQEAAQGTIGRSDPAVVEDVFRRIHLPDDDPNKITQPSQLAPLFAKGLNRVDYDWMRKELDAQQSVSGRSFSKDVQTARQSAHSMLASSIVGSTMPERAAEASYRFSLDLSAKIDEYTAAKKDPRLLITPGTPDYMLAPERVMAYLTTPQQAIADQAKAVAKGRAVSGTITPPKIASEAEFNALPAGATFVGPDGKKYTK